MKEDDVVWIIREILAILRVLMGLPATTESTIPADGAKTPSKRPKSRGEFRKGSDAPIDEFAIDDSGNGQTRLCKKCAKVKGVAAFRKGQSICRICSKA
jgi:hypothetical protein